MMGLFMSGVDTHLHVQVSECVSGEGEVVTPYMSERCQLKAQSLPPTKPPTPPGKVTESSSTSSPPPTISQGKGEEIYSQHTHLPCSNHSGGGSDANINRGTNNNMRNQRFVMRSMSSSSEHSNQSQPSPSTRRRVIFPSLHHRSSWPIAPCPNQDHDINCTGPVGSKGALPVFPVSPPLVSDKETIGMSDCNGGSLGNGGLQSQRLILPPTTPRTSRGRTVSCDLPLRSILRGPKSSKLHGAMQTPSSNRSRSIVVDKIPSVESDIPSLASTISLSSVEDAACTAHQETSSNLPLPSRPSQQRTVRGLSAPEIQMDRKKISFDPRVWVREFQRTPGEVKVTWYSNKDLEAFKTEAIKLIMANSETELVPTGTGRFVPRKVVPKSKAFFSHRALRMDAVEDVENDQREIARKNVQQREIRRILIVDPHDICVKLFAKSFKNILPHVEVVGTVSSEEALERSLSQTFDVVLVEERLKLFHQQEDRQLLAKRNKTNCQNLASGASLIRALKEQLDKALFIGVSTRLREDGRKLKEGGADLCWSKPPPKMDDCIVDEILRALLLRRCQQGTLQEIFAN